MQKNVAMHQSERVVCSSHITQKPAPSLLFCRVLSHRSAQVVISEAEESPALQMKCRNHGGSAVSGYIWLNIHVEKWNHYHLGSVVHQSSGVSYTLYPKTLTQPGRYYGFLSILTACLDHIEFLCLHCEN